MTATESFTLDTSRGITLSSSGGTISIDSAKTLTYGGVMTGSADVTKLGAGVLLLSGSNTNSGSTTISAGTIRLGSTNVLSDNSGVSIGASGTLDLADFSDTVKSIGGSGSITLGSAALTSGTSSSEFSGVISGTGSIVKSGTGTLTLSGTNTYSGSTSVSNGVLAVSNASALGATSGATTVDSGATLSISGGITLGEPITIAGSGYGSVGAIRNTSGTNTVSAQLTLSGATEFQSDAGELIVDVASGSGISGTNTNLTFDGSGNFSILDPIATGSGTLTKSGTGTLYLPAVNTFTGSTTISAGTVSINADSGLGVPPGSPTAGHLVFNGGTLRTNASFTLTQTVESESTRATGTSPSRTTRR